MRFPWTARRSNQSILKEICPEYSLEVPMLKLKLQYFSHLMQRADSLEKTMILGKIEGRRGRTNNLPKQKAPSPDWLTGEFYQPFKNELSVFYKVFLRIEAEGILHISSDEASTNLILKKKKKKIKTRSVSTGQYLL